MALNSNQFLYNVTFKTLIQIITFLLSVYVHNTIQKQATTLNQIILYYSFHK